MQRADTLRPQSMKPWRSQHKNGAGRTSTDLLEPAAVWETPFAALAAETKLGLTMTEAFALVRSFYRGLPSD